MFIEVKKDKIINLDNVFFVQKKDKIEFESWEDDDFVYGIKITSISRKSVSFLYDSSEERDIIFKKIKNAILENKTV